MPPDPISFEKWSQELKDLNAAKADSGTPVEDRYGREPDKVKPLAQYLATYLDYEGDVLPAEIEDSRKLLQQALDAYESTENVKIRIERV